MAAIAAAVALILVAVLVPALLLTGGSGEPAGTTVVTEPTLQRIDPDSSRLVDSIPLDTIPDDIAAGAGGVWLLDRQAGAIRRVDPTTNTVGAPVELSRTEAAPARLVARNDKVYVGHAVGPLAIAREPMVWTYDPGTGLLDTVSTFVDSPAGEFTVIDGDIWVLDAGIREMAIRLLQFEGGADTPAETTALGREDGTRAELPARVAADDASVWVVLPGLRAEDDVNVNRSRLVVWRVDADNGSLVSTVELEGNDPGIATGAGSVWVSVASENVVERIDPTADRVESNIPVGRSPRAIEFGAGAVWVANSRDGTVSRIDPMTLDIVTITVGGVPTQLAAGDEGVWVAVRPV